MAPRRQSMPDNGNYQTDEVRNGNSDSELTCRLFHYMYKRKFIVVHQMKILDIVSFPELTRSYSNSMSIGYSHEMSGYIENSC